MFFPALLLSFIAATANAAAPNVRSTLSRPHHAALLDLYMSEGCNGCPLADNWLGQINSDYDVKNVVPFALHVDY